MQDDQETTRDPSSGYASADALDPASPEDRGGQAPAEEVRDPMSGYASADAIQ